MTKETSSLDPKILIRELLKYWYLFVVFIAAAFIIALLYIRLAAESYNIESKIIINIERSFGSVNQQDFLEGFELINPVKNFGNEIQIMQSVSMIKEVLIDMNLVVTYYSKYYRIPGAFKFTYVDIYKETPFIVIINESHLQPPYAFFKIKILNDKEFTIECEKKDTWLYNYEDELFSTQVPLFAINRKYKFGELIENDWCSFKIILNSNYKPEKYADRDLFFILNELNSMARSYQSSLGIGTSNWDASVAILSFTGTNVQKSIDFVNGLINKYIQKNLENKNHLALTTIEYIDNQLSSISDSLILTERELQNFKRNYNVLTIEEKAQQIYNQLRNLENQRVEVSSNYDILRQLDLYFKANEDSSVDFIPASLGFDDPLLSGLMEELSALNTEKKELILTDQLRNPRLQTVNASIENLKSAIRENIRFRLSVTNNALEEIDNQIAELNFEFSKLPQAQRQLMGIERNFKLTDAVYTSLLEKRVQAQIAKASSVPDCEILEPARFMSVKSPKKMYILVGALFLGFMIPGAFVTGRRLFTAKISDPDEIKQYCHLQRLGYLPDQKRKTENVIIANPDEPISEYFRSIRSNLDYFLLGKKHKNILITSALPQEGKSFISINIAASLASSQQKTLLIGFDLRKRNDLYDEFGFRKLVGISSYLVGNASLEDIIISTKVENLDIMLSGDTPPNPVELISSEKTKDLLQEVKLMYDYVIIDTPPFGLVTDAFLLMKYSDLNIFVSRLGVVTKNAISESMEEIKEKNINNTYVIVNSIKTGRPGYYGYNKGYPYRKSKSPLGKIIDLNKSKEPTEVVS